MFNIVTLFFRLLRYAECFLTPTEFIGTLRTLLNARRPVFASAFLVMVLLRQPELLRLKAPPVLDPFQKRSLTFLQRGGVTVRLTQGAENRLKLALPFRRIKTMRRPSRLVGTLVPARPKPARRNVPIFRQKRYERTILRRQPLTGTSVRAGP